MDGWMVIYCSLNKQSLIQEIVQDRKVTGMYNFYYKYIAKTVAVGYGILSLNSVIKSLDLYVTRFQMKLFKSSNMELINDCWYYFNIQLPDKLLTKRKGKFIEKFMAGRKFGTNCISS